MKELIKKLIKEEVDSYEHEEELKAQMFKNRKKIVNKYKLTKREGDQIVVIGSSLGFNPVYTTTINTKQQDTEKLLSLGIVEKFKKGYKLTKLGQKIYEYIS